MFIHIINDILSTIIIYNSLKSNYNKNLSQLHYILSYIQSVNRSLLFIFGVILKTGEEVTSAGETRKPSLQNGVKQEADTY